MNNVININSKCLDSYLCNLRLLVSKAFIRQQKQLNGGEYYCHSKTRAEISDEIVCLAIANHIEGALIETYGRKKGRVNAAVMLIAMLAPSVILDKTVYRPTPDNKKIDKPKLLKDLNRINFEDLFSSEKSLILSDVGGSIMNDMFQTMINDFESNGFQLPKTNLH